VICDVWQSVETLTELFAAGGVKTQVVFVSACHSEMVGRAFIDAGVRESHIPNTSYVWTSGRLMRGLENRKQGILFYVLTLRPPVHPASLSTTRS
jgi:hypothetical protein